MLSLKVEVKVWSAKSDYTFACIGAINTVPNDFMHGTERCLYAELQTSTLTRHSNSSKL